MGNKQDYVETENFMLDFYKKEKDFLNEIPLFDVEDIKFPLSTNGMKIVDQTGRRVKLAGTNWSGGHAKRHCIAGLDRMHITDMCKKIKEEFNMNVIRLTYSLELFYADNVIADNLLSHNPQLKGKTAMQIFDITID